MKKSVEINYLADRKDSFICLFLSIIVFKRLAENRNFILG